MRTLTVHRAMDPEEALGLWKDTPVPPLEPTLVHGDEPSVLVLDGEPAVLLTRLTTADRATLRRAARGYPKDFVVRDAGIRTSSRVFGFVAATAMLRRNSCRVSNGAQAAPQEHATICNLAETLAALLHDTLPEQHERNRVAATAVRPEWRLPGGLWTSGIVNYSASLPYHRDRNNLDAWSAMPVVRRGMRGGHLHFPELAFDDGSPVVAECADGDVLFFNGQRFMHGVTPMTRTTEDGYRYSCVYYPVKRMCNCLSPAEEIQRGRERRTAVETGMVERHRQEGYIPDTLGVHDDEPDD